MAKATRTRRRRVHSRRIRPRPYKFHPSSNRRNVFPEDCSKCIEKRDSWENVICSVCMECPHNAVLLLCSSHDKGCRPYMCGTSFRYSNCLDQYKKASAKLKSDLGNLTCPLCRGQVKGWTIVQPARDYLNLKKRICMQEDCAFAGTFRELRKHMRVEHPCARPREVDPDVEQNWRRLEIEHDRDDVFSTIRSLIPGATVLGDYVIERNNNDDDGGNGSDSDEGGDHYNGAGLDAGFGRNFLNAILMMHAVEASRNPTRRSDSDSSDLAINRGATNEMSFSGEEEEDDRQSTSLASRLRRQGRVLLGRSGRRRRGREANQRPGPRR
ncbi:Zinc finger/BTB domain protein [Hirschfeldia incana]|nr:Zinc finger/BTB domain protein [Hirschfeldia incana]KAJ0241410.1 Zinc finger/BTB domain protein [Hirschfeldia incana]